VIQLQSQNLEVDFLFFEFNLLFKSYSKGQENYSCCNKEKGRCFLQWPNFPSQGFHIKNLMIIPILKYFSCCNYSNWQWISMFINSGNLHQSKGSKALNCTRILKISLQTTTKSISKIEKLIDILVFVYTIQSFGILGARLRASSL